VMADLEGGDLRLLLMIRCGENSSRCQISRGKSLYY
jgi:hypothetical protein